MDFCPFARMLSSCPNMTKNGLCNQEIQCKKFKDIDIMGGKLKRCRNACKTCAKTKCIARMENRTTYCIHYVSENIGSRQHQSHRRVSSPDGFWDCDPEGVLSALIHGDYYAGSD